MANTAYTVADFSISRGLIASGWHTIAMMMRMYADHYLPENGLPAPGVLATAAACGG